MLHAQRRALVCVVLAIVGTGCGSGKTVPARGKVVFPDVTPLTGGLVLTQPPDGHPKGSARGDIQPDGSFRLGTFTSGDGAVEGEHRVQIVPPEDQADRRKPQKRTIQDRYRRYDTSGLSIHVQRGAQNDFTLTVEK